MNETLLTEIDKNRSEIESNKIALKNFQNNFANDLINNGIDFTPMKRESKIKIFLRRILNTLR